MTPILKSLIEESAGPLASIETKFAVDSSGFGTSVYRRWHDAKYGREMREQTWVKVHAIVGVLSNVIAAVNVTDSSGADSPQMPGLIAAADRRFQIAEIVADKAYLAHSNLAAAESVGAAIYIPFKSNSRAEGSEAWRRMHGLFMYKTAEFLAHYHARSNVESTFSMVKRVFGGSVRAKTPVAQVNEVLCKCLAHNLVVLVHSMFELGLPCPTFAGPDSMVA